MEKQSRAGGLSSNKAMVILPIAVVLLGSIAAMSFSGDKHISNDVENRGEIADVANIHVTTSEVASKPTIPQEHLSGDVPRILTIEQSNIQQTVHALVQPISVLPARKPWSQRAEKLFSEDGVNCAKRRENSLVCLACNVYHESRNQPEEGQVLVAVVTLNRVRSPKYPKDICKVVWQREQFSWTNGHTVKPKSRSKAKGAPSSLIVDDAISWQRAVIIADKMIREYYDSDQDIVINGKKFNRYMFFHEESVRPNWGGAVNRKSAHQVGSHIFYMASNN